MSMEKPRKEALPNHDGYVMRPFHQDAGRPRTTIGGVGTEDAERVLHDMDSAADQTAGPSPRPISIDAGSGSAR